MHVWKDLASIAKMGYILCYFIQVCMRLYDGTITTRSIYFYICSPRVCMVWMLQVHIPPKSMVFSPILNDKKNLGTKEDIKVSYEKRFFKQNNVK